MLYLHITKILLLFPLSYFVCRVDIWCKLIFNYDILTVNMVYDYDYDELQVIAYFKEFPLVGKFYRNGHIDGEKTLLPRPVDTFMEGGQRPFYTHIYSIILSF